MSKVYDKIKKVFDGGEKSTLVHLNTEQADRFIDYMVNESVLLQKIRVIKMDTPEKVIAKIGIGNKILFPAGHTTGFTDKTTSKAKPDQIKLKTKKSRAKFIIGDDELEDNIEGDAFKDHLMRMAAKVCANQLEIASIYGRYVADDGLEDPNCVDINNQFNGFITRASVILDAANSDSYDNRTLDLDKLTDLRLAMKSKYRASLETIMGDDLVTRYSNKYAKSPNQVDPKGFSGKAFINAPLMSTESPILIKNGAKTTLSAKNTQGAKTITVASAAGFQEGTQICIAYNTNLEFCSTIASVSSNTLTLEDEVPYEFKGNESVHAVTLDGAEVLMTDPRNLLQGIQRSFKIEFERDAEHEQTAMYTSIRTDFQVENEEALAVMKGISTKAG